MVEKRLYCERFDVMYNPETNTYLESKCSDPSCIYCSHRPLVLLTACRGCPYFNCPGYKKKTKKLKA